MIEIEKKTFFNTNISILMNLSCTKHFSPKFNVQTSHYSNVILLFKSPSFNNISVTKSVLVQFPMFSNANQLGKVLNFDISIAQ